MNEKIRKSLLYILPIRTYWKSTKNVLDSFNGKWGIGHYPQSIAPRIDQGHYTYFDEDGIPCFPNSKGILIHHYTTLCSYALGHWEKFLLGGNENDLPKIILQVADYLKKTAIPQGNSVLFLDLEEDGQTSGIPCAMNQGEAISVLIRAHALTKDASYLDLALAAANAFDTPFNANGVYGLMEDGSKWYLEAGKFILNGHCYAVMGLMELAEYSKNSKAEQLFKQGVLSIEKNLHLYDTGFWSRYWANKPEYTASVMYHNLHIIHLEILGKRTSNTVLLNYSKRFESYASNPLNRLKAILALIESKKRLQ